MKLLVTLFLATLVVSLPFSKSKSDGFTKRAAPIRSPQPFDGWSNCSPDTPSTFKLQNLAISIWPTGASRPIGVSIQGITAVPIPATSTLHLRGTHLKKGVSFEKTYPAADLKGFREIKNVEKPAHIVFQVPGSEGWGSEWVNGGDMSVEIVGDDGTVFVCVEKYGISI
ncbi:hypothetical protein BCR33DRAFT_712627 [Rhizoclosmatium globosum]|uniref:Uncharacterized protein n=1 Tax=Rhizoclosmatium globosum TaxID=329046 RepID=A0A1Y2CX33_9FUNG|nr:hypothetical protein BCR33DRAFT_712627 [Rhizoclosmatium globosum]|eukprot:ORY51598.1 hypothetical protein BCR33DRAFT_712627 [Rhizoclosmatium globosum]